MNVFEQMSPCGRARSWGRLIPIILRNYPTDLHSGCPSLQSHQQWMNVPLIPHSCHHELSLVLMILEILMGYQWDTKSSWNIAGIGDIICQKKSKLTHSCFFYADRKGTVIRAKKCVRVILKNQTQILCNFMVGWCVLPSCLLPESEYGADIFPARNIFFFYHFHILLYHFDISTIILFKFF